MENPCKIMCFGDSLTRDYVPLFEKKFKEKLPEINAKIINKGIGGETSRDGLKRLDQILKEKPNIVIIGFGMNDKHNKQQKISLKEFHQNLIKMINRFENAKIRALILNLHPLYEKDKKTIEFNKIIKRVTIETRIRLIDIYNYWTEEFGNPKKGLRSGCHVNQLGNEIYCKALLQTVPRRNMIILWAYNGISCECNYHCPYCQYELQKGHYFSGTINKWHKGFKKSFGNQHLVFYFGHGEPMIGKKFFDVVDMIGKEPNWEMRIISNLSGNLKRLVSARVTKEGRLNINGSFHPTMISAEKFLEKLLFLRKHNIEVPAVYTLWPPFFKRFEKDFETFNKYNFLIHVRRFRGNYKNKWYPSAYTEKERQFIARYTDDATIKYMLHEEPTTGKVSYTGMTFIFVDNKGNIGYCDDVRITKYHSFGNILKGKINLLTKPTKFKPENVSDGTVDGVANILELNYRELENNHILSFARQGGVCQTDKGMFYKNMNTDFNDSKVRAEYNFMPRNLKDLYYILKLSDDKIKKIKHIYNYKYAYRYPKIKHKIKNLLKQCPMAYKIYKTIKK